MYEVTQDYLDKATAAGRVYSLRVDVGEVIDGFYEDKAQYFGGVGVLSLKIVRGQTTGGFSLGGTVCAQLSATFTNDVDVRVKDRLQVYVRFGSGSEATAWKSLGWFYVDAVKQGLYNKSVTAYDAMLRFEKNYKSKLTYPASTSNVLNEISEQMKIGLSSNISLINDVAIDEKPQRGENKNNEQLYYTRREMLGYIGAINGGGAYIDVDFKINLAVPTETGYTIAATSVISQSVDDTNFVIDGIVWNKSGVSYSLNDEFTENTIELVNPLSYGGAELILHNLETKLVGLAYSSVTLKKQGTGVFQLGDLVNYAALDGTVYTMLVMGIVYDFANGFFSETLYSLAKSASQQEYAGSQVVSAGGSTSSQINVGNLTQYEVLSDTEIVYNGTTYTFSMGESGEITEVTTDKGGPFTPTIPGTITNLATHNAAFMAVAMLSKLSGAPEPSDPLTAMCIYRYNCDSMTQDGSTVNWHNQADGAAIAAVFSGATVSDNSVFVQGTSSSRGLISGAQSCSNYTIYMVARCNVGADRALNAGPNIGGGSGCWAANAAVNTSAYVSTIPSTALSAVVLRGVSGGMVSLFINGSYVANLPTGTQATQTQIWFGSTLGEYFDGAGYTFCDFALSGAAHSEADVIKNSQYLMQKYGIS